ncbi:MAG TPA: hypothetical protein PKM58_11165 [Pyrinomonadaceae bacterium]|nr:hypothetical protein [Pyrinomonadaceae bacterium]HNU06326.1 hypothetical protein [Pyrinomonadaceae bacterium]
MRIAATIVRILLGLLLLFASIAFFANLGGPPELNERQKAFFNGLTASRYILPVVKTLELLCAIAFVSGYFVPLATLVFFPIAVNILLTHVFVMPDGLPVAIGVAIAEAFMIFVSFERYTPFLAAK